MPSLDCDDGQAGGRLEELKIRLTQPSLARTGAELGNNKKDKYNSIRNFYKNQKKKKKKKKKVYVTCDIFALII
jgi:hypothetical protein